MNIDNHTRVLIQGITGKQGQFHTARMMAYGTRIVAGVTPGKGGTKVLNIPVFNAVSDAVRNTQAQASVVFVPRDQAMYAVMEAVGAGIRIIVCITEGMPVHDTLKILEFALKQQTILIGPNCPGILIPGQVHLGIMPAEIFKPGNIGIVSRSGTLMYEAAHQIGELGFGQSCCIGVGGDIVIGWRFIEALDYFQQDSKTEAILLIGEIGGSDEEEAAIWIQSHTSKPIAAYIAGKTALPEKRMGHAGALISEGEGTALSKIEALRKSGVRIVELPTEMGKGVHAMMHPNKVCRSRKKNTQ